MNIKQYIILICIASGFSGNVLSQRVVQTRQDNTLVFEAERHELDAPKPNVTSSYTLRASEYIKLKPGFHHVGTNDFAITGEIDRTMVFPPTIGTTGGLNEDDEGVVGAIAGSYAITPTGAVTYSIPLDLPAGTAGMMPRLAIAYNSMGGDGYLGLGWDLEGLSAITRGSTSLYLDTYIDPVDYDSDDKFFMDGQRLEFDYMGNGTTYRTLQESYTKIEASYGGAGNSPDYFTAYTKDGRILEYGTDIAGPQANEAYCWLLSKVSDRKGNYVQYHYVDNGDEFYIDYIEYTGNSNTGSLPYFKIKFNYNPRVERNSYHYGKNFKITQQLISIEVTDAADSERYRKYTLQYGYDSDFTMKLQRIGEEAAEDSHNSTFIGWNEEPSEKFYVKGNALPSQSSSYDPIVGDFNGDGKSDIIMAFFEWDQPSGSGGDSYEVYTKLEYYKSLGNGNFQKTGFTLSGLNNRKQSSFIKTGDFNADGCTDLAFITKLYSPSSSHSMRIKLFKGSEASPYLSLGQEYYYTQTTSNNMDAYANMFGNVFVGDIDGNRTDDLVFQVLTQFLPSKDNAVRQVEGTAGAFSENANWEQSYFFDIRSFENLNDPNFITASYQVPGTYHKLNVGYFDGDSKMDLIGVANSKSYIYAFKQDFSNLRFERIDADDLGYPTKYHDIITGDVNGDGNSDMITYNSNDGTWRLNFSDGKAGWVWPNSDHIVLPLTKAYNPNPFQNKQHFVLDINGDGKGDVVELYEDNNQTQTTFDVITNCETASLASKIGAKSFIKDSYIYNKSDVHLKLSSWGDFNGDGRADVYLKAGLYSDPADVAMFYKDDQSKLVSSITGALGHKTTFSFSPLTLHAGYTKGSGSYAASDGCVRDIQAAIQAPASIMEEDNAGNTVSNKSYSFESARVSNRDGFLGFGKIAETEHYSQTKRVDEYEYIFDDPQTPGQYIYMSRLKKQQVYSTSNNQELSSIEYSNKIHPMLLSRHFYYVDGTISRRRDLNGDFINIVKTDYSHHFDWGDIDVQTICVNGSNLTESEASDNSNYYYKTETDFDYAPENLTDWISPKINSKTVTFTDKDASNPQKQQSTTYAHDGDGYLTEKTIEGSSDKWSKEEYAYNDYGNLLSITQSGAGVENRVTTFPQYDAKQRFATKKVNPLGHEEIFDYNNFGRKESYTDPNGLTTFYEYDDFGNLEKVTAPDGRLTKNAIRWCKNGHEYYNNETETHKAVYYTWSQSSGLAPTYVFYDGLGRELRTVTLGFDGTPIYVDKEYNGRGLVSSISNPYFEGGSERSTTIQYDALGRKKTVSSLGDEGQNLTTTMEYAGKETSVTNPKSQTDTKTVDALGRVAVSTDNLGNSMSYKYLTNGLVKEISDPWGNTTELKYDILGNRDTLIDPDYGMVRNRYNAYSELTRTIKPTNEEIDYSYDALGRVDEVVEPEGTISYVYDETTSTLGLLGSVSYSYKDFYNATTTTFEDYSYDGLCRLTSATKTIAGQGYTTSYTYDDLGREKTMTYPGGFIVRSYYNKYGYTTAIKDSGNEIIWQVGEVNAQGQLKAFSLGGGILAGRDYNPYTGILEGMWGKSAGSSTNNLQDIAYEWDDMGNLDSRGYAHKGISESFSYDGLNRLDDATVNGTLCNYDYDPDGNLILKSDVGTFEYNDQRPHAISNILPTANTLASDMGQDISYTSFDKISHLEQAADGGGLKVLDLVYGPSHERVMQEYSSGSGFEEAKVYVGRHYKKKTDSDGGSKEYNFVYSPYGLVAVQIEEDGNEDMYYVIKDHLGSINVLVGENGAVAEEYYFDAWGWRRNPADFSPLPAGQSTLIDYGFTGHEHLDEFGLINMTGRVYDPALGRFLSPDNYVQNEGNTQSYNRYSYCINNPLKYNDPSGEIAMLPIFLGAMLGTLNGAMVASNSNMGFTASLGTIVGGGVIGGLSGWAGGGIAQRGGFMANTAGIMTSSTLNSSGMSALTGGQISPNINFGAGSFNLGTGELEYIGKKENKWYENMAYGFGALANIQDIVAGVNGGNIEVRSYHTEKGDRMVSHSTVENNSRSINISVSNEKSIPNVKTTIGWARKAAVLNNKWGAEYYIVDAKDQHIASVLKNVNAKWLETMTRRISSENRGLFNIGKLNWGLFDGCVQHSSYALWGVGIPTLPINFTPAILNTQLNIREIGICSSPYLTE